MAPTRASRCRLLFSVPAVAGPFDLGVVDVKAAVHVDPVTAQVTAKSDPLPTILQGIPLDVRDIRVNMDRPNFILNPTSCDEMSVDASPDPQPTGEQRATPRDRFQLAEVLAPGLQAQAHLLLEGQNEPRRPPGPDSDPSKPRRGDANISRVSVALPKKASSSTRPTSARSAPGPSSRPSECPRGAIYGEATVTTPLLRPKARAARSTCAPPENLLPDLVPDLRGPADLPNQNRVEQDESTKSTEESATPSTRSRRPIHKARPKTEGRQQGPPAELPQHLQAALPRHGEDERPQRQGPRL